MVIMVSIPRSGSKLIFDIMYTYFNKIGVNKPFCESYGKCNSVPCSCANNNEIYLTKTHDFDMLHEINPNHKYIVIYRKNKLLNFEAYCRFIYRNEFDNTYNMRNKLPATFFEFDMTQFPAFIQSNQGVLAKYFYRYYDKFIEKYSQEKPNIFIIDEEKINIDLQGLADDLIDFLELDPNEINKDILFDVVNEINITFSNFDDDYYEWFKSNVDKLMNK
jgi:hypothetical protein